jgi:pyruvate dehydrogenase E2 component (dihydrolipoamide acetyltransferase)
MSEEIIKVPDLGGEGDVVEIFVKVGDKVEAEQAIVMLESSKASMEVPTPKAGIIKAIHPKMGDTLNEGDLFITLEVEGEATAETPTVTAEAPKAAEAPQVAQTPVASNDSNVHAGPGARALARELNVDLSKVAATGPKDRITKEDIQAFASGSSASSIQTSSATSPANITPLPNVDFSKFGEIEEKPMSRLMQAGAKNLTASWQNIPHVTYSDDIDITSLEEYRKELKPLADKAGIKVTMLPFLIKCVAQVLQEFPVFNSSLSSDGKTILLKKYVNIGFAVDTPDGLLVPVIKGVDKKGVFAIAKELVELADKARNKQLKGDDMSGGCFTITSLGHIGGTNFTPIVNPPEVAILGVTRSIYKPVYNGTDFDAKLMLPLSISFDHRVINGADAARFIKRLSVLLGDLRMALI